MIFNPRAWLEPHLLDVLDALRFEIASARGRFRGPKHLGTDGKEYLQLGSGDSRFGGFLNSDFYFNKDAEAQIDARFPLPFPDGAWRGIYAHHVIEHLSYPDAFQLLRECHRVLRPGGILRMVVPDLEVFLRLYCDPEPTAREKLFRLYPAHIMETLEARTPLELIDYIFRDNKFNRHLSAWDWETAELRLKESGFSKVHRTKVNESVDPQLSGRDKAHWSCFSLYVDALK